MLPYVYVLSLMRGVLARCALGVKKLFVDNAWNVLGMSAWARWQENDELRKTCEVLMESHAMQMHALRQQQVRASGPRGEGERGRGAVRERERVCV